MKPIDMFIHVPVISCY